MNKLVIIKKTAALLFLLAASAVVLNSCVYFNTYYNAQKYYKLAEKENENPATNQQVKPQNYNKSIETAAKIPELYPNSKYVDDALLLMGKCYYKVGNFPKAQRKFDELLSNYPNSELVDEASLYRGECLIENRSFDQAREALSLIASSTKDKKIAREANFALAALLIKEEKYLQAADIYLKTAENANNKKTYAEANLKAADCFFQIKDYISAADCYLKASTYRRFPLETRFDARYKWTLCLYLAGDLDKSRKGLNEILKNQKFFQYHSRAQVLLAEISFVTGDIKKAESVLNDILKNKPKTEESAHADYVLGKIYQLHYSDFPKSEEFYKSVKLEKADSPYANSADVSLKILTDWRKIVDRIDSLYAQIDKSNKLLAGIPDTAAVVDTVKAEIDRTRELFKNTGADESLPDMSPEPPEAPPVIIQPETLPEENIIVPIDTAVIDTSISSVIPDSAAVIDSSRSADTLTPAPLDTQAVLESIEKAKQSIFENRYQLSELLFFQLKSPDTSKVLLKTVIDSAQTELIPKAIYLYAHICRTLGDTLGADSLDQILINNYPSTPYGISACRKHNIPVHESAVDSAAIIFDMAEIKYDSSEVKEAFAQYAMVDSLYPDSPLSPKALFARAYIAQNEFGQDSLALALLQTLAEKYPKDTLAVIAQKRTTKTSGQTAVGAAVQDTTAGGGSKEKIFTPDDVDFTPVCEKDSTAITQMLLTGGFYPRDALVAQVKGKAIIALTVDIYGDVQDSAIVSEDPADSGFGQAALNASAELRYTPGKIGSKLVPVRIEQEFLFKPPRLRKNTEY